jgi:hypothetical protein
MFSYSLTLAGLKAFVVRVIGNILQIDGFVTNSTWH